MRSGARRANQPVDGADDERDRDSDEKREGKAALDRPRGSEHVDADTRGAQGQDDQFRDQRRATETRLGQLLRCGRPHDRPQPVRTPKG